MGNSARTKKGHGVKLIANRVLNRAIIVRRIHDQPGGGLGSVDVSFDRPSSTGLQGIVAERINGATHVQFDFGIDLPARPDAGDLPRGSDDDFSSLFGGHDYGSFDAGAGPSPRPNEPGLVSEDPIGWVMAAKGVTIAVGLISKGGKFVAEGVEKLAEVMIEAAVGWAVDTVDESAGRPPNKPGAGSPPAHGTAPTGAPSTPPDKKKDAGGTPDPDKQDKGGWLLPSTVARMTLAFKNITDPAIDYLDKPAKGGTNPHIKINIFDPALTPSEDGDRDEII
ncbi:MAG: hypothetical protein ACT6QX_20925, partial [Sphingopyxis sp.]